MQHQPGKIILVGFGNIGQGLIALLRNHFPTIQIICIDKFFSISESIIRKFNLTLIQTTINQNNYTEVIGNQLEENDFLLNLATELSTLDFIKLAQSKLAFYIDTCIEPWSYAHHANAISTSNYSLREDVKKLAKSTKGNSTAIVAHGANPGFVSILVKRGLELMGKKYLADFTLPTTRKEWAHLAKALDIVVIQISERDTQVSTQRRAAGEFVCTWSVDGLVTECLQPAELGWGTHETELPHNAVIPEFGCKAAISINQPSCTIKVKSWSPNYLDFDAFLITHNEAISIADYLTLKNDDDTVSYRPTSYYAYHPCDDAVESIEKILIEKVEPLQSKRVLKDEIISGIDELGVFLVSQKFPSLWVGSNLSIGKARKQAPFNNATSLQVASSVIAGMLWAIDNPRSGVIESEEMNHHFIYQHVNQYWGPMVTHYVDWTPQVGKKNFKFNNFLVS